MIRNSKDSCTNLNQEVAARDKPKHDLTKQFGFLDKEMTVDELEIFRKRMIEDDRMDSMFRAGQNLTEKFDNRAFLHPHGMADYDYRSIPAYRQGRLEKLKHKTRLENYEYLAEHRDVDALFGLFFKKLLQNRPTDSVRFAAEFFTKAPNEKGFKDTLEKETDKIARYRVSKMKEAGKVTTKPYYDQLFEIAHEQGQEIEATCVQPERKRRISETERNILDLPEKFDDWQLNWLKKLNIGPLAQDLTVLKLKPAPLVEIKSPIVRKTKKKHVYCGCKDPGRREKAHPTKKVAPKNAQPQPLVDDAGGIIVSPTDIDEIFEESGSENGDEEESENEYE